MALLLLLNAGIVIAYRSMTAAGRAQVARQIMSVIRLLKDAITLWHRELESLHTTLHARTRVTPITPTLIGMNAGLESFRSGAYTVQRAVFGEHYTLDAVAGRVVASAVWWLA